MGRALEKLKHVLGRIRGTKSKKDVFKTALKKTSKYALKGVKGIKDVIEDSIAMRTAIRTYEIGFDPAVDEALKDVDINAPQEAIMPTKVCFSCHGGKVE